jgi:hypothetical protein
MFFQGFYFVEKKVVFPLFWHFRKFQKLQNQLFEGKISELKIRIIFHYTNYFKIQINENSKLQWHKWEFTTHACTTNETPKFKMNGSLKLKLQNFKLK